MSSLRLSPHAHLYEIEYGGRLTYALRHSMLNHCYFLDEQSLRGLLELLEAGKQQPELPVATLEREHLLVPTQYDSNRLADYLLEHDETYGTPVVRILYLSFSSACNLACDYCFVEGNTPETYCPHVAEPSVVKAATSWAADLTASESDRVGSELTVIGYGGEPLLAVEALDAAFAAIKTAANASGRTVKFELVTNGTLFSDDIAGFLRRHDVGIAVSLDGFREAHDKHRVRSGGAGTFNQVESNMRRMRESGLDFGVSCTVTEANRDRLPDFVGWLSTEFGVKSVGLNLLLHSQSCQTRCMPTLDNRALGIPGTQYAFGIPGTQYAFSSAPGPSPPPGF